MNNLWRLLKIQILYLAYIVSFRFEDKSVMFMFHIVSVHSGV